MDRKQPRIRRSLWKCGHQRDIIIKHTVYVFGPERRHFYLIFCVSRVFVFAEVLSDSQVCFFFLSGAKIQTRAKMTCRLIRHVKVSVVKRLPVSFIKATTFKDTQQMSLFNSKFQELQCYYNIIYSKHHHPIRLMTPLSYIPASRVIRLHPNTRFEPSCNVTSWGHTVDKWCVQTIISWQWKLVRIWKFVLFFNN